MNVKIDTKEKFTTITLEETKLPANMTENIKELLLAYLQKDIPHIVLNLKHIAAIDTDIAIDLAGIQQEFYEKNCSFVICEMKKTVETIFDELELLELLNFTPTESEAWDIIQMEEIERELLQ
ncbi:MAG: STAS domain-containing protein [Chitinophagaceae bacterium]|nr:STAS domain-containing protein [Chitinophagaceae bacterium]